MGTTMVPRPTAVLGWVAPPTACTGAAASTITAEYARSAYRHRNDPGYRYDYLGVRPAQGITTP